MTDVNIDALNHVERKLRKAIQNRKNAVDIDKKIFWSRLAKRYRRLRERMFR